MISSLNPCSNGTLSDNGNMRTFTISQHVLILVLMEHSLTLLTKKQVK